MCTKQQITIMKSSVFWDIMLHNLVKINLHFGGRYHLHLQGWIAHSASCFMLVSCLAYSLTLKMEVVYLFEMSTDFHFTYMTLHLKDRTLQCQQCNNRKSQNNTHVQLQYTWTWNYKSFSCNFHLHSCFYHVYQMAILQNLIMTLWTHYK
jgi:hypothetical protein